MNLKPGLMQIFGRFLSINQVYIFCPNLHKPYLAKTRFWAHFGRFSLENQVSSRFRAGLGDKPAFQTDRTFATPWRRHRLNREIFDGRKRIDNKRTSTHQHDVINKSTYCPWTRQYTNLSAHQPPQSVMPGIKHQHINSEATSITRLAWTC
jgi:hypothetical protein